MGGYGYGIKGFHMRLKACAYREKGMTNLSHRRTTLSSSVTRDARNNTKRASRKDNIQVE